MLTPPRFTYDFGWSFALLTLVLLLAGPTDAEAAKKKVQQKGNQRITTVQRNSGDRKVTIQRREIERKNGPDRTIVNKTVVRNQNGKRVELQRTIDRREDRPTRNVLEKTVTNTSRDGHTLRTVTLDKKVVNVGGERASVSFDRDVTVRHLPKPSHHGHGHSHGHAHYAHGHALHHCDVGCGFYRKPVYYGHGHPSHVCASSCSHYSKPGFSISIGVGGSHASGHFTYTRGYTPCHHCGAGYYKRVYVPGSFITCFDACGRPYRKYVPGYYETTWIPHTCLTYR